MMTELITSSLTVMQVHLPLCLFAPLCIYAISASVRPCVRASVRPCISASVSQCMTLKGHTQPVNSVAWGKVDQLATASDHRTAVVWNVASGELV